MKQFHKTQAVGEMKLEFLEEADLRAKGMSIELKALASPWQCMSGEKQRGAGGVLLESQRKDQGEQRRAGEAAKGRIPGSRGERERQPARQQQNNNVQRFPGVSHSVCWKRISDTGYEGEHSSQLRVGFLG